jgi:hypothetical protein
VINDAPLSFETTAKATPLARSMTAAVSDNNRTVFLIPLSLSLVGRRKKAVNLRPA